MPPIDKTTPTPVAPMAGHELLHVLLRESLYGLRTAKPASPELLRTFIRPICDSARQQGLRAEQLLVIVKQSWARLEERDGADRREAAGVLGELITAFIKEYYQSDNAT